MKVAGFTKDNRGMTFRLLRKSSYSKDNFARVPYGFAHADLPNVPFLVLEVTYAGYNFSEHTFAFQPPTSLPTNKTGPKPKAKWTPAQIRLHETIFIQSLYDLTLDSPLIQRDPKKFVYSELAEKLKKCSTHFVH